MEALGAIGVDGPDADPVKSSASGSFIERWSARARTPHALEFFRFIAVGLLNTTFGYAIYSVAVLFGARPAAALAIAMVFGVTFNFFTTGRLVFREKAGKIFPRFVLGYLVVYGVNLGLLHLTGMLGVGPFLAQALALPPTVIFTFMLMKFVVFRRQA